MKFDVIVGNPPFQDVNNKVNPLWQKFVKKLFQYLNEKGYLCMIHPSAWRKPEHELFALFKKGNLKYVEIHNQKDGFNIFKVGTRYDWYVLQNKNLYLNSDVVDENGRGIAVRCGNSSTKFN